MAIRVPSRPAATAPFPTLGDQSGMFLDCTGLIAANEPHTTSGIAVSDLDGDGAFEIVVAGHGCANRVLKWQDGGLADVADPAIADPTGCALGVAAADVDGDGREELYVLNSECASGPKESGDRLFAGFGQRWIDLLSQPENQGAANTLAGRSVAALDRHGSGRYGFAVASDGGPFRLYELSKRGRIADAADEAGLDLVGAGRGLTALPLVSERMDLVACNEGGPNFLFANLGDGTFEEIAGERGLADPRPASRAVVPFDADGDGLIDLLVGTWEGSQRLWLQRAGGGFADAAGPDLSMPARIGTVIVADFDNDGFQELFFNIEGEENRLFAWRHDEWQPVDPGDALEPRALGSGAAVVDIDGDGRLELIVGHRGAPLSLYRPLPNGNAWLRVLPLTPFGAPARGAIVTCTTADRRQTRVVCAGSGYLCQMEPVAHFGLGTRRAVERVEVRWPSGAVAVVDAPPVGRLLTVPHPPS